MSKLFVLGSAFVSFALVAGCAEDPAPPQEPVVRPIKILTIDGSSGGRAVQYTGTIEAGEYADMSFEVAGRIVELPVNEGQVVTRGQLLARIDPADYQSRLDQAQADYNAAESAYKRYEDLVETGAISRQDFDQQKRNFEVAAANLDTAEKALRDTRLVAPFAGNVGRRYVRSFVNIQAKEPILVLQDTSTLNVVVSIPEQDWSRARPDEDPEEVMKRVSSFVTISTFPGREFPAVLKEVAKVADPVTRTFEAKVTIDRPADVNLLPGMSATVHVSVSGEHDMVTADATMLPASAVFGDDQAAPNVWVVDPESMRVSARPVELGDMAGSDIRIIGGLAQGDKVAISGVGNLREGMQVRELTD